MDYQGHLYALFKLANGKESKLYHWIQVWSFAGYKHTILMVEVDLAVAFYLAFLAASSCFLEVD